jgi:hypothetical protein
MKLHDSKQTAPNKLDDLMAKTAVVLWDVT